MSIQVVVSDSINRRVQLWQPAKLNVFQLAVANIAKGRARGKKVHRSLFNQRDFYVYELDQYRLYYSLDPRQPASIVFEEFISEEEEDLILDLFAEGRD